MRIIKPSFLIEERSEERGGLWNIMQGARVCYKSDEEASREDGGEGIVKRLIARGHESPLEHGDYIFLIQDERIAEAVREALTGIAEEIGHHIRLTMTHSRGRRWVISGNVRAWRELMAADGLAKYYFAGAIDPVFLDDLVPEAERGRDKRIEQIFYRDLVGPVEKRAHLRQTVRFIIDRGVSHEFVRHRVMSFSQESTRYCNYSLGKFGREITVIEPCFLAPETEPYSLWKRQCMSAEVAYFQLLNEGLQPQEARAVLPTCVKTELLMTGTLGQWRHFFELRAEEKTGPAHPQAVEVARPLMLHMAARFPEAFGG